MNMPQDRFAHDDQRQRRSLQVGAGAERRTWRFVYPNMDSFAASGLTEDIEILQLQPREYVAAVLIQPTEQWAAAGLASLTLSVGIVGNLTKYAGAYNVAVAPSGSAFQLASTVGMESVAAPTSIRLAATAVGANLSTLSAGEATVAVLVGSVA